MPVTEAESPLLNSRFEDALVFAARLHHRQLRKGKSTPYISHLLAVASLVLEDGGDEDEVISALLHDAVEDQGGQKTLAEITARFGERVANIVAGCTDADSIPKPPWRERKEAYIDHLRTAETGIRRVSLADKLHNARTILADLRQNGPATWKLFNGGKEGTLWYYQTLVGVFMATGQDRMALELERVVAEILRLATARPNP